MVLKSWSIEIDNENVALLSQIHRCWRRMLDIGPTWRKSMLVTDLRCWRPIFTLKKSVDSERRSMNSLTVSQRLYNNIHNLIQKFKHVLFRMCFYPSSDLKNHIALNALKTNVFYHHTIRTKVSNADLLQKSNRIGVFTKIHAVIVLG